MVWEAKRIVVGSPIGTNQANLLKFVIDPGVAVAVWKWPWENEVMTPEEYSEAQSKTASRFVLLVRDAKLRQLATNEGAIGDSYYLIEEQERVNARERLVAFASEYLALEINKRTQDYNQSLSPRIQDRFDEVSEILDRHLESGPEDSDIRRSILEKAEEFVSISPHYDGGDWSDDNDEIRDRLNSGQSGPLGRYLLDRELGLRPKIPEFTGDLDKNFTRESARELTDALGHLHQVLLDHVNTLGTLFNDERLDDVSNCRNRPAWRTFEIERVRSELAREPPESALLRTAKMQEERAEQARREASLDSFLTDTSEDMGPSGKRRRDSSDEEDSDGGHKRARLDRERTRVGNNGR